MAFAGEFSFLLLVDDIIIFLLWHKLKSVEYSASGAD